MYTANIFNVIFTLFMCVPLSTVIPLYYLHLITTQSTVENVNTNLQWFTVTSKLLHCTVYGKYLYSVHFFNVSHISFWHKVVKIWLFQPQIRLLLRCLYITKTEFLTAKHWLSWLLMNFGLIFRFIHKCFYHKHTFY